MLSAGQDLLRFADGRRFATILADPPWQFTNKTGKVAPEHKRLARYGTMKLDEIGALPVPEISAPMSVISTYIRRFAFLTGVVDPEWDQSA